MFDSQLPVGSVSQRRLVYQSGVVVFKASMLNSLGGGPSAKVGSSAKFVVAVFKVSMLYSLGGPSAKVYSSIKFCVLVFKRNITCQSCNLLLSFGGILGLFWGLSRGLHLP